VTRARLEPLVQFAGPALLILAVALVGSFTSHAREIEFRNALVNVAIVVALYVFIGNSGVLSFGHVSFVAVGAFLSGVLTIEAQSKQFVLPELFGFLQSTTMGAWPSLGLAALIGGVYAFVVGLPLMRLSGLPAGIATFAVLGITYNVLRYWTKIGPGPLTLSLVPETTTIWVAAGGGLIACAVALLYQRSRAGRQLRATREDAGAAQASGIDVYRQRLLAFTLSGALAGFAGGLLVHLLGSITTDQVYLNLTFLTLAMLVIGGVSSLAGAVVGALLVSGLNSFLGDAENGVHVGFKLDLPNGTSLVVLGAFMALVLILRPRGITGGREFSLPRWGRSG
jgi:branched-chain amino acid transport system permease protein